MNIKQVRYVCAIMDLGSFSAAAAHEGVSVQAVSKAMAELESSLGGPLFERRSAGVVPTALGRHFAEHARRVLEEWEALERFAAAPTPAPSSPQRIGFCCPVYEGVERLVRLISTVTGKVLGRHVDVEMLRCSEGLDALLSGRVDALITIGPLDGADVTSVALGTVSSAVILPADHPLAAREELTLDDLGAYPVLYPVGFDHFSHTVVDGYLQRGLRSEPVEVGSGDDVADFYDRRHGYSFIAAGNITGAPQGFVIRELRASERAAVAFRRALSRLSLFA